MTRLSQLSPRARRAILVVVLLVGAGCSSPTQPSPPFSTTDLVVGTGTQAFLGNTLAVNYTGWLYDSTKPDSKGAEFGTSAGVPLVFVLGAGQVIAGWDEGLAGMRVGGQRRLIVPPVLAYDGSGSPDGSVPPNSSLVFDITLVGVS